MRQFWTNRLSSIASLIVAAAIGLSILPTNAQQRMIPIPERAKQADITFNGTLDIFIDGKVARLAPGARITDRNNLLILPGALQGVAKTRYTVEDTTGLVMQVWILTVQEIATPPKSP